MNTMKYKGYIGTVGYSEKDEVFFGKVEGINGLISFEGTTVQELQDDFHQAVNAYLDMCASKGIAPQKSHNGVLNIRINPETHSKIAAIAICRGVKLNTIIKDAIQDYVTHCAI